MKPPGGGVHRAAEDMEDTERGIGEMRKDLESLRGRWLEVQTRLRELTDLALSEATKMRAIKCRLDCLGENGAAATEQPPALPGGGGGLSMKQLDWELEKLHVIQRLLGASPPQSFAEDQPLPVPPVPASARGRVLVVDDDPVTVNIVTHFLRKEDYQVLSSLSGIEGLRTALRENPDLIVLDILMPDLTGFQFLSAFRRAKRDIATPVIILSTLSGEEDVLRGLEFGAADYLTKPFSPQVLIAKVNKILGLGV